MKKTILIAPFEGPLAAALAREARTAGYAVVVARSDTARSGAAHAEGAAAEAPRTGEDEGGDFAALPWNPASYVSASALLLGAKNALGELDAAIVICEADALRVDLVGGKPGEVDSGLQRAVLGPALLCREIIRAFEARKAGDLVLVARETAAAAGPARGLAAGAFHGLGDGVFESARESAWRAWGVVDSGESCDDGARFTLRVLAEGKGAKSGRWLRFTGKPGLFGIFQ